MAIGGILTDRQLLQPTALAVAADDEEDTTKTSSVIHNPGGIDETGGTTVLTDGSGDVNTTDGSGNVSTDGSDGRNKYGNGRNKYGNQ